MPSLSLLVSVGMAIVTIAQGATVCLKTQPRAQDAPASNSISEALHKVLATHKNGLCSGAFPTLPNGSKGNKMRRSAGGLVMEVVRDSKTVKIDHSCADAFNRIISDCIRHGNFWGGNASSTGVHYAIYNEDYPKNWRPDQSSASQPAGLHPHSKPKPKPKPTPSSSPTPPARVFKPDPKPALEHSGIFHSSPKVPIVTPHATKPTRPSGPITTPAVGPPPKQYKTVTLKDVTGKPNSFSQTKTTDSSGHATILPIWFDAVGAAIIVTGVLGAIPLAALPPPPPPAGFPQLRIGSDGRATLSRGPHQNDNPTPDHPQQHSPSSPSPSPPPSSSARLSPSTSTSSSQSSSSKAPSGPTKLSMIIPKNGMSSLNLAFTAELTQAFGHQLTITENEYVGVMFWAVPLTALERRHYASNDVVRAIETISPINLNEYEPTDTPTRPEEVVENARSNGSTSEMLQRRAMGPTFQDNADYSLFELSLPPPGQPIVSSTYNFDAAAGVGSTIYILDTGANADSTDYKRMPGSKRWLYVDAALPGEAAESDPLSHGACVISKAAGWYYGVAKRANVVSAKIRYSSGDFGVMRALDLIARDITLPMRGKVVVNISIALTQSPQSVIGAVRNMMDAMIRELGVIFVVPSGNFGGSSPNINQFPAAFGFELPIIVVGAVDEEGITPLFSQGGPHLTVSAPGVSVLCSTAHGDFAGRRSGTSFASPAVAGLAAYLLSLERFGPPLAQGGISSLAQNMKTLVQRLAYKRGVGRLPVAYNGYLPLAPDPADDLALCSAFGLIPKRGEKTACCKSSKLAKSFLIAFKLTSLLARPPLPSSGPPPVATHPPVVVPTTTSSTIPIPTPDVVRTEIYHLLNAA
ncbi:MAG: hypothetical protein M4579_007159 [Chaenotheca gracillima]|nr:MAG: hypothetical protein M4579_007159 [Chaenotheca gracillima]